MPVISRDFRFFSVIRKLLTLPSSRRAFLMVLAGLSSVSLSVLVTQLISNNYVYGGESLELASMVRVSQSKPYVSYPDEVPLLISPYTPVLFWLVNPLLQILNADSLREVVVVSRLVVVLTLLLHAYLLREFFRKNFADHYSPSVFGFSILWFFVLFPGDILSVSADFLSFLFEFLALMLFHATLVERKERKWGLTLSSICTGIAIGIKVNTIGIFLGMILFMLANHAFRSAFIHVALTGSTAAAMFGLFYWHLRDKLIPVVMTGALNRPKCLIESFRAIGGVFVHQSAPVFYFLVLMGVYALAKTSKKKALLFSGCLGFSFVLATLGQMRNGAYMNYHFGFFMLSVIPVSIALKNLFADTSKEGKSAVWLRASVIIAVSLQLVFAAGFPVQILQRYDSHTDEKVAKYITRNHPTGYIYTEISAISLRFLDRALLGPWAEWEMEVNPFFKGYIPDLKQRLAKYRFSVGVIDDPQCENWEPSGIFLDETKHLRHLESKIQGTCIFVEK